MKVEDYLRERLLDLVSCYGRPKLWESIANTVAQKEHKALLCQFALEDESWNVRGIAARMYARLREGDPIETDPVFTSQSSSIRDCILEGAADVGDKDLIRYYCDDPDAEIAQTAREYLD